MFDVAVDLRRVSPTFGRSVGVVLSAANQRMLWMPPGFAHGFLVLSEYAEFLYKTTDYWYPEHERTLLWNDPALGIAWPLGGAPTLAAKDAAGAAARGRGRLRLDCRCRVRRILLTGADGQVGFELARSLRAHGDVDRAGPRRARPRRRRCDRRASCARPGRDSIVNAGAYTAVDLAETERAAAFAVNARAPGILAEEAKRAGAVLIHYSTDYVFDGARTTPYDEDAPDGSAQRLRREQARGRARDRGSPARARWCCARAGSTACAARISC